MKRILRLLFVACAMARAAAAAPGDVLPGFDPGPDGIVYSMAELPDGSLIIGGDFTTVGGEPHERIARLAAGGTVDTSFAASANNTVYTATVMADGKILIGGLFTSVNGTPRNHLARLNPDGSLDAGFAHEPDGAVRTTTTQADGKILIGGDFTHVGVVARSGIARLNADASVDSTFVGQATNGGVYCAVSLPDGSILVGGGFTAVNGTARSRLARMMSDGTLSSGSYPGADQIVYSIAAQPDGKFLIGGGFTVVGALARNCIARLNADGSVDASFNPGANSTVFSIAVQADAQILIGGVFDQIGGVTRSRIARLNNDGTLDAGFNPNADDTVRGLMIQADGKILAGGSFTTVGGVARNALARLDNAAPTQSMGPTSAMRLEWLRGGTSMEAHHTTFEVSTDGGATYTMLGPGVRIPGGWERGTGILPTDGLIRARARTGGGCFNGSGGLVETITPYSGLVPEPPEIAVSGNGVDIADDDSTPGTADHTDFGSIQLATGTITRTFTIRNTGMAPLVLGTVTVGGAHASDFSVTAAPATPLAAGVSTTFQVRFTPTAGGTRSATLSFSTNDGDENPFNFSIQGTSVVSSNANLASLTVNTVTLSPAFSPAVTSYASSVRFGTGSVTVTLSAAESHTSLITVNGAPIVSGGTSGAIPLGVGVNLIAINVTAQDGTTVKTYTIEITRAAITVGDADPGFNPSPNGSISSLAMQPDGKILIGGSFTTVGGVTRNRIARLNADGTLDSGFNPNANGTIRSTALHADGKILIGGDFTTVGGVPRNRIARLNVNGTLDSSFNPNAGNSVSNITLQTDGKILIGGAFTTMGGVTRNRIARLNANGTMDSGFNPNAGFSIATIALQADGKILIGGSFSTIGGVTRNRIARLNADGTLDSGFIPNAGSTVNSIVLQADGKILTGGAFTTMGGVTRNYIARLNADGTLDSGFNPNAGSSVFTLALQADGKILTGGAFTTMGGVTRNRIARVNADGTLDSGFDPVAGSSIFTLAVQADGKILAGGDFTTMGGAPRNYLARLENEPATQNLSVTSGGRVEWLRGGTSPEALEVTFELSTDGGTGYAMLGSGTRIAGGWELCGLSLPSTGHIRALARTTGDDGTANSLVAASLPFTGGGTTVPPDIAVSGNGTDIPHGDATPSTADHTDFGSIQVGTSSLTRTFTISNQGTENLMPGSITLGGAHAADFTVTATPASHVSATAATTFTLAFTPGGGGLRQATVSIASNDSDENPFTFSIQGTGTLSGDADLSGLSVSADPANPVVLSPAFTPSTTTYSASAAYHTSSVRVTPVVAESHATITVNGTTVPSGTASGSIAMGGASLLLSVVVTAQDGTTKDYVITLMRAGLVPGEVDPGFNPAFYFYYPITDEHDFISAMPQADGKILTTGRFYVNEGPFYRGLARLRLNGSTDNGFSPPQSQAPGNFVQLMDGRVLAAGINDGSSAALFNANGTLVTGLNLTTIGSVIGATVQPDGKTIIFGSFVSVGGVTRNGIARINPDGTLDTGFAPGNSGDIILACALQPDGKILFSNYDWDLGQTSIVRRNTDGSLDSSFTSAYGIGQISFFHQAHAIAVQPDGKILIGG